MNAIATIRSAPGLESYLETKQVYINLDETPNGWPEVY